MRSHGSADLDSSQVAHHHTLGPGHNQAAAGDHTHSGLGTGTVDGGFPSDVYNSALLIDGGTP